MVGRLISSAEPPGMRVCDEDRFSGPGHVRLPFWTPATYCFSEAQPAIHVLHWPPRCCARTSSISGR
nr:hypothetical protein CFP56_19227 [Quercus suber]